MYFGDDLVGTVHDASPLVFEYAPPWLARAQPMPVAAIPLQPGRNNSARVQAFFENLLPKGELRQYIAERQKASTIFSLLLEVAGDTAGGFVIVPPGQPPLPCPRVHKLWPAGCRNLYCQRRRKLSAA